MGAPSIAPISCASPRCSHESCTPWNWKPRTKKRAARLPPALKYGAPSVLPMRSARIGIQSLGPSATSAAMQGRSP
eukprot:scaffold10468_cov103-Isochrysis_galbana.AAC.4